MRNKRPWISLVSILLVSMCTFFSSSKIATPPQILPIDQDGKLNISSARLVLQHAVKKVMLSEKEILRFDQDLDGALTIVDARIVLQKVVGKWNPVPSTESVDVLPTEGESVDFVVLGQSRITSILKEYSNGLYVAKSYTDLEAIFSKLYRGAGDPAPVLPVDKYSAAYFTKHAVLVLHCKNGAGNTTLRMDQILRADGQLILCSTAMQALHPTPDMGNRYVLIEIDNSDLDGVRSLASFVKQEMADE